MAAYGGAEMEADVVGKGTEAQATERIRGVREMEKEFIKKEKALLWDLCGGDVCDGALFDFTENNIIIININPIELQSLCI